MASIGRWRPVGHRQFAEAHTSKAGTETPDREWGSISGHE